jgi:hypothetical protein
VRVGSLALHRVAETLMGHMDASIVAKDWRMAAAYAQLAADAEGRALETIPLHRRRTRSVIWESHWTLIKKCLEYEARAQ